MSGIISVQRDLADVLCAIKAVSRVAVHPSAAEAVLADSGGAVGASEADEGVGVDTCLSPLTHFCTIMRICIFTPTQIE